MSVILTEAQRDFLEILSRYQGPVSRRNLPLADRAEDRVRQSCRKLHLAAWVSDKSRGPSGWAITIAGRMALINSRKHANCAPQQNAVSGKTEGDV